MLRSSMSLALLVVFWPSFATSVELFELSEVELLDGPFRDAMLVNREHLLQYDPDRLLAPFLIEAGFEPKARRYANWESTGLDGHTAGHYLSALANQVAATGDPECRERLVYMVDELARCQSAHRNGYVGGVPNGDRLWTEVAGGDIRSGGFSLNGGWVPLYNLHKTFAGLRDAYQVGGVEKARDMFLTLADWCCDMVANLDDNQVQRILSCEHGGMNEVLADAAVISGDDKYLSVAERFSHRAILDPLAAGQDALNGLHANTQVPKVVGFLRIAQLGGDARGRRAAQTFWDAVVHGRSLAFGGNSIAEHFPSPSQSQRWVKDRQGPETCNTYNMLRLTELLFCDDANAAYADFYERAVLNHILSSQHPNHGGYVYFTPARPRHYRVYSQPGRAFWCCVGSGMENHGKYGRFIYAHDSDELYVNLFVASKVAWKELGVTLTQETRFPDEEATTLKLELEEPRQFALKIRCPAWITRNGFAVSVNGDSQRIAAASSDYVTVNREWQDGDRVEVSLPMRSYAEPLPYLDEYVALLHGPVVLAAKTGAERVDGLLAGEGRMDHVANGPLQPLDKAPMLVADPGELADMVKPIPGESLKFTLADAIRPNAFDGLVLEPFFRVHDARYMLYWRSVDKEAYQRARDELEAEELRRLALDRATVDHVAPGEQQPETEHNFQGERTSIGVWQDRHFRHADGWFSYDLKTGDERGLKLRVTYFGSDSRRFAIRMNDQLLAQVKLDSDKPGEFFDVDYPIPADVIEAAKEGVLTVRFEAEEGSMAGGLFGVRLLKQESESPVD